MRWDDFRKSFRKDRRFYAYGRDEREREKLFKAYQRQLGEEKKRKAEQADSDFVVLLQETLAEHEAVQEARAAGVPDPEKKKEVGDDVWSRAKKGLDKDPRYDAVGSSTRRAELFRLWLFGERRADGPGGAAQSQNGSAQATRADAEVDSSKAAASASSKRKDAAEALREREAAVRAEKARLESQNRRALTHASREDSTVQFKQMLIDVVRDPLMMWNDAIPRLQKDSRFNLPGLFDRQKRDLFEEHMRNLAEKRRTALYAAFARAAENLDDTPEVSLPLIKDDSEVERLGLLEFAKHEACLRHRRGDIRTDDALAEEFDLWQERRFKDARAAFDEMLKENSFVEFWGRLRQSRKQQEEATGGKDAPKGGLAGGDESDEELEKDVVDMVANFDLSEVHAVLRNDARYRAFKHRPEDREQWIRVSLAADWSDVAIALTDSSNDRTTSPQCKQQSRQSIKRESMYDANIGLVCYTSELVDQLNHAEGMVRMQSAHLSILPSSSGATTGSRLLMPVSD